MNITTLEIWPVNAKKILKEKKVNTKKLKKKFSYIFFPWDEEYEKNNVYFSFRIQQHPLFIIKVNNEKEIMYILNYVKAKNLTIRICNGRHSTQLLNPEILIDTSLLIEKKIKNNLLIAGSGNTQGMLNDFLFHDQNIKCYSHFGQFLHSHENVGNSDEAFAGGSASTVGSGSISTIGGIGTLKRTFGLTIDSILSYKIILPPTKDRESKLVKVDSGDLFWALKGGGANNFGIVTEVTYNILHVNNVINYYVLFTRENVEEKLRFWRKNSLTRGNNFNEEFYMNNGDYHLSGFYVMNNDQTYNDAVKSIKNELNMYGEIIVGKEEEYDNLYKNLVKDREYLAFSIIQALFLKTFSVSLALEISENGSIVFELLNGKISENNEGSFYPRDYSFFCDISAKWNDVSESQKNERWVNESLKKILKVNKEAIFYLGFPVTFDNIDDVSYYGSNKDKLKRISNKVDPLGIMKYGGTL